MVAAIFFIGVLTIATYMLYMLLDDFFGITIKWFTPYINAEEYNLFDREALVQLRKEIDYHMHFSDTDRHDLLVVLDKLTALRPRIDSLKSECKKSYYAWNSNYRYLEKGIKRRLANIPARPVALPKEQESEPLMNMRKS